MIDGQEHDQVDFRGKENNGEYLRQCAQDDFGNINILGGSQDIHEMILVLKWIDVEFTTFGAFVMSGTDSWQE